jgi:hypothetical protein
MPVTPGRAALYQVGDDAFGDRMTNEPDSTSGPRPPTIELKATEVGVDKPEAAPQSADDAAAGDESKTSSAPPWAAGSAFFPTLLAGVAGGVIAAIVIGAGLWFAGYIPPRAPVPAPSAEKSNDAAIADLSARLAKIENAPHAQPQPDPALASRLAAAEAATKSLADQVAALNGRIDSAAGAAQKAQAQAAVATDTAKSATQTGVARSDLDALTTRVAALESTVKKLAGDVTQQSRSADDRAARLTVATEALRAAVERGVPFAAELAAAKSFSVDQSTTAALEPFATVGAPSATVLAGELASLAPALQQAVEPAADKNTFLGRLETNAQHLVQITPVDAPAGDDPASIATRIEVDAAHADIAAALADIAKLPDGAKSLAATWVQKAQARNAAIAASRKLAADALAALTKPNPQ